jgi:hypothetical protein
MSSAGIFSGDGAKESITSSYVSSYADVIHHSFERVNHRAEADFRTQKVQQATVLRQVEGTISYSRLV